jgi:hypothetical protein
MDPWDRSGLNGWVALLLRLSVSHIQLKGKLCDALSTAPWLDGQSFLGLARADEDFRLGGMGSCLSGVFTLKHEVKSWTAPQAVYSEAALLCTST